MTARNAFKHGLTWGLLVWGFAAMLPTLSAQTTHIILSEPRATLGMPGTTQPTVGLDDLVRVSLDLHPKLLQVGMEVDVARGQALQAGLYPNPVLSGGFDELGDRTGPGGINTFPFITQEIVTKGKLPLNRAVAERDIDLATLDVIQQRMELITTIRNNYFQVLAVQQEISILEELNRLAYQSFNVAKVRMENDQIAELEYLQFRVELNRWAAKLEGAERRRLAAWQQLTASMGAPHMGIVALKGSLDSPLPRYEFPIVRDVMLQVRPEVQYAQVNVAKAHMELQRAEVQKYPNITVGAGYTRQNQNKSDDYSLMFEMPLPIFDRNQGNILSAQAKVGKATSGVERIEYELIMRLAEVFGRYDSARKQMARYEVGILADTKRAFEMSMTGYKEKQFDYLKVLQAQKMTAEARLEYLQLQLQAWQSSSELAGLLLQDHWPWPEQNLVNLP